MPLMPKNSPTVELEIDGDTYTLKTYLTFAEREETSEMQAFKLRMPYNKVERGKIDQAQMVDVVPDFLALKLRKLQIWIVKWSHNEPLVSANLRRLPPAHADAILAKIAELEAQGQRGIQEDSPLEPSSTE